MLEMGRLPHPVIPQAPWVEEGEEGHGPLVIDNESNTLAAVAAVRHHAQ